MIYGTILVMTKISQTLKKLMKEQKITVQELSNRSGVPFASIKSIRQGLSKNPRGDTLRALSTALGCTIDELDQSDVVNPNIPNMNHNTQLFKRASIVIDEISLKSNSALEENNRSRCIHQLYNFALESAEEMKNVAKIDPTFAQWLVYNTVPPEDNIYNIKYTFDRNIELVKKRLSSIAIELSNVNTENLELISDLLHSRHMEDSNNIENLPYTNFDWENSAGLLVVSSLSGIMDKPVDMSFRPIIEKTKLQPNIVHTDKITIGIPSNKLIVVLGIGINNTNGDFAGTLATGVDISRLNDLIS